jgi:hypothetical protein
MRPLIPSPLALLSKRERLYRNISMPFFLTKPSPNLAHRLRNSSMHQSFPLLSLLG